MRSASRRGRDGHRARRRPAKTTRRTNTGTRPASSEEGVSGRVRKPRRPRHRRASRRRDGGVARARFDGDAAPLAPGSGGFGGARGGPPPAPLDHGDRFSTPTADRDPAARARRARRAEVARLLIIPRARCGERRGTGISRVPGAVSPRDPPADRLRTGAVADGGRVPTAGVPVRPRRTRTAPRTWADAIGERRSGVHAEERTARDGARRRGGAGRRTNPRRTERRGLEEPRRPRMTTEGDRDGTIEWTRRRETWYGKSPRDTREIRGGYTSLMTHGSECSSSAGAITRERRFAPVATAILLLAHGHVFEVRARTPPSPGVCVTSTPDKHTSARGLTYDAQTAAPKMDDGPDEDVRHHDVHLRRLARGSAAAVAAVREKQIQATLHAVQRRVSAPPPGRTVPPCPPRPRASRP